MITISSEELGDKARQSSKWYFSLNFSQKLVFFFCTIIVARLLTPEDFGLAAISMTLDVLIWLIISFGINSAIIHFQDNMEERLNAAFWLFITVMGGFSAVIIAASPLIAKFYNAPIITPIFQFSAIALFIYSFGAVHKAILYRQMDFKQASILDAVLHTLKYVLFVAFAFAGFRVWSFIYPKIIIALICVVCLWKMTAWQPKLELGLKYWREMFNYGKNVLAGNILDFLFNNSTHLLIGNIVSPAALGIYSFANDKAIMMINNIAQPATMMSFPAYSRMQGELDKLKEVFIKTIRGISLIVFPYTFWQIVMSREFITYFYGEKWEASILVFQVLLLYTMFKTVSMPGNSLLQGIGRPDIVVKWNLAYAALLVAGIFIGYNTGGLLGITAIISFLGVISSLSYLVFIFKHQKWSVSLIYEALLPAMLCSIIGAIFLLACRNFVKPFLISELYIILLSIPAGLAVYFTAIRIFFPKVHKFIASHLKKLNPKASSPFPESLEKSV